MNIEKERFKVLILVGGLGKRLEPLTYKNPKPMIKINGKPFLEFKISYLKSFGLKDIILCVGYLGEVIEGYFGNGNKFGVNINYSYEKELLGTGGAIKNAENLIDKDFLAMNGDTYIPVNFNQLIEFHDNQKNPLTMVVSSASNPKEQELIELNEDKISKIYKRDTEEHKLHLTNNKNPLINSGIYVIKKSILNEIPKKKVSLEHEIFPKLIGRMSGFLYKGYHRDLTTVEDCEKIENELKNEDI
jgi:NDP-sugar pyrophosphorylase family protein